MENYKNIPDLIKEVHTYKRDLRSALQSREVFSLLKTAQYTVMKRSCLSVLRKILTLAQDPKTPVIVNAISNQLAEVLSPIKTPDQLSRDHLHSITDILNQLEAVIVLPKQPHFVKLKQLL